MRSAGDQPGSVKVTVDTSGERNRSACKPYRALNADSEWLLISGARPWSARGSCRASSTSAPPHTSPRAITAAELVAGIVLGMVLVGGSIRVSSGLILLEAPG
jgi:hypothetical protein